ncbi:MAG: hypothetical protein HQ518_30265 [Rhodopirellula sp.]|nr:hypothetical protein [Rhodopirellula sp.]
MQLTIKPLATDSDLLMRELSQYLDEMLHKENKGSSPPPAPVADDPEAMGPIEIITVSLAAATFAFDVVKWVAEKLQQRRAKGTTLRIEGPDFVVEVTWTSK